MYRFCPNCESKNVIVYEMGEDFSYCLDCAFTWRQVGRNIVVARNVLRLLAGLKRTQSIELDSD